jgi:multidrug efflux pump
MTSLTFILGVLPLAFASGPGSGAQNAISVGVLGGITAVTVFVLFFAPYWFIWVYRLLKRNAVAANRRGSIARGGGNGSTRPGAEATP